MNLNERNNESSVVEGFRRSREGKDVSLDFTFKNMSVVLPTGKKILSGVTGKISAGRVTAIMVRFSLDCFLKSICADLPVTSRDHPVRARPRL